jgi:ketosteroid isomerase-like protein
MKSLRIAIASLALPIALAAQQPATPQANPMTAAFKRFMNSLLSRSTAVAAVAIASLLTAAPARAQSDERAIVAVVTKFLDGIRTRDTALMRSTIVAGATLVPVGGPTGLGAPSTIDAVIERTGKGTGPGNDERIEKPMVQIDDQLASLWTYFTLTRAGETKIDRCGTNLFLLRKGPDGWKVFQIAATSRTEGCRAIGK